MKLLGKTEFKLDSAERRRLSEAADIVDALGSIDPTLNTLESVCKRMDSDGRIDRNPRPGTST